MSVWLTGVVCVRGVGSLDYFLLHCEIASALWNAIFSRVGLAWVMPKRVVDLLACWKRVCGSHQGAAMWKMASSCLLGCLWMERNERSFEDCKRTVVELKSLFFKTLFHWTTTLDLNMLIFFFLDILNIFPFLARCFFCIYHIYLSCAFCVFNDISFTFYKTKNLLPHVTIGFIYPFLVLLGLRDLSTL
jgi:hypothetical protein